MLFPAAVAVADPAAGVGVSDGDGILVVAIHFFVVFVTGVEYLAAFCIPVRAR